ncbi:MAG TPA: hypothetical protein VFX76_19665, partial [Roseiflexaceae bacterium]|nr:hypothetical protein [Roseiflexaceae bacterium]
LLIAERIVLLHSPSGAGKTSLVKAGLIKPLETQKFRVLPVIRVGGEDLVSTNGHQPKAAIGANAANGDGASIADQQAKVTNRYILSALLSLEKELPPEKLATVSFEEYLDSRFPSDTDEDIVLIFDQFEEILTVEPTNEAAKYQFFEQVGEALRNRRRWALFSMREDYVAALAPYLWLVPTRLSTTYRLDLLRTNAAHAAIEGPAKEAGIEFETEVTNQLIEDLSRVQVRRIDGSIETQPGPWIEPVQLQVVCERIWRSLPPGTRRIGKTEVGELGDIDSTVDRALSDFYKNQVAKVADDTGVAERDIRDWFDTKLITSDDRRGQVQQGPEQGLDSRAIKALINKYLVRQEERRAEVYELAHDRLIKPV